MFALCSLDSLWVFILTKAWIWRHLFFFKCPSLWSTEKVSLTDNKGVNHSFTSHNIKHSRTHNQHATTRLVVLLSFWSESLLLKVYIYDPGNSRIDILLSGYTTKKLPSHILHLYTLDFVSIIETKILFALLHLIASFLSRKKYLGPKVITVARIKVLMFWDTAHVKHFFTFLN